MTSSKAFNVKPMNSYLRFKMIFRIILCVLFSPAILIAAIFITFFDDFNFSGELYRRTPQNWKEWKDCFLWVIETFLFGEK